MASRFLLLSEIVRIDFLDLIRNVGGDADSVLDHQVGKSGTIDQDYFVLNFLSVFFGRLREAARRDENTLPGFLTVQSADKRLNLLTANLPVAPAFCLYVNRVQA